MSGPKLLLSALLVGGGVLALALGARVEERTLAATPAAAVVLEPHAEQAPAPPATPTPAAPAPDVASIMREEHDPAACVLDPSLDPAVQLVALRKLERDDPTRACELAYGLLESPDRQLRVNAIAILARDDSPRARDALAQLDPRSRRLATAIANRR